MPSLKAKNTKPKPKKTTEPKPLTAKQFAALSVPTQRIRVAEDVIAQLKARRYKASPGTYAVIKGLDALATKHKGKDLRDVLPTKAKSCSVCALGSMFLSTIRLGDNCKIDPEDDFDFDVYTPSLSKIPETTINEDLIHERIFDLFGSQKGIIETAFEGTEMDRLDEYAEDNGLDPDQLMDDCRAFYEKFSNAEERLTAIMENIVRNKGNFTVSLRIINP